MSMIIGECPPLQGSHVRPAVPAGTLSFHHHDLAPEIWEQVIELMYHEAGQPSLEDIFIRSSNIESNPPLSLWRLGSTSRYYLFLTHRVLLRRIVLSTKQAFAPIQDHILDLLGEGRHYKLLAKERQSLRASVNGIRFTGFFTDQDHRSALLEVFRMELNNLHTLELAFVVLDKDVQAALASSSLRPATLAITSCFIHGPFAAVSGPSHPVMEKVKVRQVVIAHYPL